MRHYILTAILIACVCLSEAVYAQSCGTASGADCQKVEPDVAASIIKEGSRYGLPPLYFEKALGCEAGKPADCAAAGAFLFENEEEGASDLALRHFARGCQLGHHLACQAAMVLPSQSDAPDAAAQEEAYANQACEHGFADGCFREGLLIWQKGAGISDLEVLRGNKLIICACEQGHQPACEFVAQFPHPETCAQASASIAPSDQKASLQLELAASGDAEAQHRLGADYTFGNNDIGIEVNKTEAVKWLTLAAEQNYAPSQNLLAWLYGRGDGVEKDISKAIDLYKSAASSGDLNSHVSLAYLLLDPDSPHYNRVQAAFWLEHVAYREPDDNINDKEDIAEAAYLLALVGESSVYSPERRKSLLDKAIKLGHPHAAEELDIHCTDYPESCK